MMETMERAHELAQLPSRRASIAVDRTIFSDDWSALRARVEALVASLRGTRGRRASFDALHRLL